MKTPRSLSGIELATLLAKFGYRIVHQKGSHMKLTTTERGQHHIIVPRHGAVRVGTLHRIFSEVAQHFGTTATDLARKLFEE